MKRDEFIKSLSEPVVSGEDMIFMVRKMLFYCSNEMREILGDLIDPIDAIDSETDHLLLKSSDFSKPSHRVTLTGENIDGRLVGSSVTKILTPDDEGYSNEVDSLFLSYSDLFFEARTEIQDFLTDRFAFN